MGNMCGDKEASPTRKQKKCSKCGINQGGRVFTAYQGCSHLICQDCTEKDGNKQFVCPLGPDKPNAVIEFGRQLYCSVIKPASDDQLCPNKHKMVWRDDFELCSVCNTHLHGFKCRICNHSRCTICSQVFKPTSKKCPNKHPLTWRLTNIFCLICGNKRHGSTCRQCRWYACSQCCDTKFNAYNCPNGHKYQWKSTKSVCSLCNVVDKVFECTTCKLVVCALCCGYSYERISCPNGHPTKISQRQICTKCEAEGTGMSCTDCGFHFCTKCDLERFATVVRSPLEAYSTVKVIVQNPLLHFERQNTLDPAQQRTPKTALLQFPQNKVEDIRESHSTKSTTNMIDPIELIREEISSNPQSIPLYLKLADAYRQASNYKKQTDSYITAYQIQEQKSNPDPQILYSLLQKGSTRSFEQNNISKSLMFTDTIINLCQTYPKVQHIFSQKQRWMLMRVEQLILVKELDEANMEMRACDDTTEGYERVRLMMESAIDYRTHV